MAAKTGKTKRDAKCVYVISGKDKFLVATRCELLLDEVIDFEHRPMCLYEPRADEAAIADVLDELRTLPFCADRRVVLIKDAGDFISANREILEKYFDSPSPTGVLVLTVQTWHKNSRLAKKLPKIGSLINVEDIKSYHLLRYVSDYLEQKHDKLLSEPVARLMVELVGDDPGRLCREADKLAVYVGEQKRINALDVEKLIGYNRTFSAFAVIDAITAGDITEAIGRLRNMFAGDKSAEYTVVGAFAFHFRRMFRARCLLDEGVDPGRICKQLGIWANKPAFFSQLGKVSLEMIGQVLAELARIDYSVKTGRAQTKVAVEQLLLELDRMLNKS